MFVHFRCGDCHKLWAIKVGADGMPDAPYCPACGGHTRQSGTGAAKVRGGATVLTSALRDRQTRAPRAAAATVQAKITGQKRKTWVDSDSESSSSESDDEDDEDFLIQPARPFNIRMRLTAAAYQARGQYRRDVACRLDQARRVLGTAGRGNLNTVMGAQYFGAPTPANWPAWRHHGTPRYSLNPKASSEWCHLVADSLGGPSTPDNLVAASYGANTFMYALESMINGQAGLSLEVTAHCSVPHVGEWIKYRIVHRASGLMYKVGIDARATSFNAGDLLREQTALQAWLAARGIAVALS